MNALTKDLKITRLRRYTSIDPRKLREGVSQAPVWPPLLKEVYSIKTHRFCPKDGEHLTAQTRPKPSSLKSQARGGHTASNVE
jgi:hypothetical protein